MIKKILSVWFWIFGGICVVISTLQFIRHFEPEFINRILSELGLVGILGPYSLAVHSGVFWAIGGIILVAVGFGIWRRGRDFTEFKKLNERRRELRWRGDR